VHLSANEETSGKLFEIMGGWAAQTRWQRAGGYGFPANKPLTPEAVIAKWKEITNFGMLQTIYVLCSLLTFF
jgi:multifunctional beta-oxidation protein